MIASTNAVAKIAAVVAGLGLVAASFASFAPMARAATAEELQAQVDALLAQIAGLGGGSTSAGTTFTMDLTLGSTGAEVTALQNWLIAGGYSIPAGATGYFGAQTQSALAAYQAANGISPAAGYFGPITRAKVNAAGGGSTGGSTGGDTSGLSGGEASLEDFEGNDGEEDEVAEGDTGKIAEFEFEVEDGDVRIERVDLTFETAATGSEEDEPWETFETITLYVNGEEAASEDVSDEDDWLENDEPFMFRFSGIDAMVEEGDNALIEVEVEVASSVDGADTTIPWTVEILDEDVRAIDAEGIDQYTGDSTGEEVTFDVVEEGEDDELTVRSSDNDPDSTTLQVEDDSRSDWFTVFVYELEADEDGGDIEINEIPVNFMTDDSDLSSVVNDVKLVVDGEEFDDFDWSTQDGGNDDTSASTTFDIDGDVVIASGETVEVEVMVEFKALTGNYAEGTTIQASTTGADYDAEGADDITVDGSATSDTHYLRSTGIDVDPKEDEFTAETNDLDGTDNDSGEFEVVVDITAFEEDIYISATSSAFTYQLEDGTGTATTTSVQSVSKTVSSTADVDSNSQYRVDEGSTEEFIFKVTFSPGGSGLNYGTGDYRMQLLTIRFDTNSDTNDFDSTVYTASPADDFETDYTFLSN